MAPYARDGADPTGPRACPRCAGALRRIRRRWFDRLLGRLRPVNRYRCRDIRCGWTGNLAVPRVAAQADSRWRVAPPSAREPP
ncbi:MAG: hypothetical protein KGL50_15180 [Burkholderiales bacterium]|nr:hypothetical protein [Burkholderiales bacterium]